MAEDLAGWTERARPPRTPMQGRTVRLEPLDPERHGSALFQAAEGPGADPRLWDRMPVGPFGSEAAFRAWLDPANFGPDGRQRRRLEEIREAIASGA